MLEVPNSLRSIAALEKAVANGLTVQSIVQGNLQAIKQFDGELNSITVTSDHALSDATKLDKIDPDQRGLLHGVTVVVKDQIETAGMATAFGSIKCKDYLPAQDATLVHKLKQAGAVILAKSAMPDWAAAFFSPSSLSGTTQNPYDLTRDTGSSSSGTAAAVAAGLAVVGIGGDTGGSIRLPSSFCGLVGVRVTPGRISRNGMSALLDTQDTPGPMTNNVEDAARLLDVLVGFDETDPLTSANAMAPTPNFSLVVQDLSLKGKRIGILRQAFGSHSAIVSVVDQGIAKIEKAGADTVDVTIPDLEHFKTFTSFYATKSKSDINKFLASREGLRHLKIEEIQAAGEYHRSLDLIDVLVKAPSDYSRNVHHAKRLIEQRRFQLVVASIFAKEKLDAIIYPTSQLLAPKTEDVLSKRWSCVEFPTNTIIASQLLFPAISVPIGKTRDVHEYPDSPELPVGLEILGLPLQEERILSIAAGVEAISGFERR